ncbi:site-specific integrase [Mycolicibacterium cosmeticum]|uniref:tyrosine-type recombinase/integrase n=1 Tax=Mycolicibacterium cosmeticum TaxID=258533 RepID=UPI003204E9B0
MSAGRTNGEGTIYRRKDGRWEGAAYLPTPSGKRRRIRLYGRTRTEASTKLTQHLADAQRGIPVPEQSWTVAAYLDYWMGEVAPQRLRPHTIELYESIIRNHIKPRLGSRLLAKLSVAELQSALNQQLSEGHSLRTVGVTRTVLSAALSRAVREQVTPHNVARLVELPSWERSDIQPWSADEAARFLSAAKDHPLYPAYLMLMIYGLRRGEALGLRWSDIDWDHNVIHIRQQLQSVGQRLLLGPLKTRASRRDLPLLLPVRAALIEHQRRQPAASSDWNLVTTTSTGAPMWPRNFVRAFHTLRKRIGLRHTRIHDLRHMTATQLKNLGVPDRDAQLILGHSHISTTQQIYQHGDNAIQRAALDRIGQALQMAADDSDRSRQAQPSTAESVVAQATIISGTPGRIRTYDPLFRRLRGATDRGSLTSVSKQLRARTNMQLLGYVAVKSSRQISESLAA